MPEIRPFRGLRYHIGGEDLALVLSPPYDVISASYRDALYARDPRNVIRMELNRTLGDAGYADAGDTLLRLRAERVIRADDEPSYYVLEQTFDIDGRELKRLGLIARCRAEDLESGSILPHEHTRAAAREDRWRMLLATRANFSPIFLMHDDPRGELAAALAKSIANVSPVAAYLDDQRVVNRLYLAAGGDMERYTALIATGLSYIADGHHRYATALRYRDQVGPEGAWTMAYFTPMQSPGLSVQPYHRVLTSGPSLEQARDALGSLFRVRDVKSVAAGAHEAAQSPMPHAFALAEPGRGVFVAESLPGARALIGADTPAPLAALDSYLLHHGVLPSLLHVPEESVQFVHSLREAEEALEEDRCRLAVLMRGTPVAQIKAVADNRLSMPPKSTFFQPKLPAGLVIHEVEQ